MKVALGIGCDRGTPAETLQQAVRLALAQVGVDASDVVAVVSITLKADEAGLLDVARQRGWTLRFHTPDELAAVPVPNPSETVRRHTGTPSVSEAAALLAAWPGTPMTALRVEKLKLRGPDGRHATVSVAQVGEPT
jgi:cobalt-precorrin 5A hydrolase